MAKWNMNKKVLDHVHSKFWRYDLRDIDEPNLQKDVFPYEEVSRIDFDHKIIPINPAEEIFITDTTFRDGQQARPPYTVKQILDLYKLMSRLGGEQGIIRQTEKSTREISGQQNKQDELYRDDAKRRPRKKKHPFL
mgnify:CR=1 FL=1